MTTPFFASALADILFRDQPDASGPVIEDDFVDRFERWFVCAERKQLHIMAGYIDRHLVKDLPGPQQLRCAQIIESRAPEIIEKMPTLRARYEQLKRSSEFADIFRPINLRRLARALREELGEV